MKKSSVFMLMLLTIVVTAAAVYMYTSSQAIATDNGVYVSKSEYDRLTATQKRFSKVLELEQFIKKNYYEDTSKIDFDTAIIKGLFSGLNDPYSTYFTKEEFTRFNEDLEGSYVGIGTYVEATPDNLVKVVSPIKGSPADKAGVMPGDIIYKVDETELNTITLDDAVNLMRGEAGTKVTIYVRRGDENLTFELERQRITVPSVEWDVRPGNVGYLRINSFERTTAQDFKKGLADLKSKNVSGIVLDLRNNPGGLLNVVIDIADQMLGKTDIVSIVSPNGQKEVYDSDETNRLSIPYVVLINKGSASASEILAGAIKDTHSAKIIGEKSFGKGIVQSSSGLQDGSGFKLTTSYYLTPAGNNIHKVGITPDITLEQIKAKGYTWEDTYRMGEPGDAILQFAIDYLLGKVQP